MKRTLQTIFLALLASLTFTACTEDDDTERQHANGNRPLQGEYIRFTSGTLLWEAEASELGSLYAKTSDMENPQWYDIVACTEDVNDFNIEHYRHHLFLHIDLKDDGTTGKFQIIYYKDKNTERVGEFALMLQSTGGTITLERNQDKLSGEFTGTMQNMSDHSDTRQTRFVFHELPISTINKSENR